MLQQFDGVVFIVEQPPTSAKKQWAYTTSQGVLGGLINEGWGVGRIITELFKTIAFQDKLHSSAAKKMLLIVLALLSFNHRKTSISFQYKLEFDLD